MSISTIQRDTSHPPIALTHRGLIDHAAMRLGLWLLHWAKRSEVRHDAHLARRQERLVRQEQFDRLMEAITDREAAIESTMVLRAMR
jgi:hypothetical protein